MTSSMLLMNQLWGDNKLLLKAEENISKHEIQRRK